MKTLSIVTFSPSVINANFIVEHKDFPLSIIPSVYNPHFFKICIVPKGWDYRQGSTVIRIIHSGKYNLRFTKISRQSEDLVKPKNKGGTDDFGLTRLTVYVVTKPCGFQISYNFY